MDIIKRTIFSVNAPILLPAYSKQIAVTVHDSATISEIISPVYMLYNNYQKTMFLLFMAF